MFTRLSFGTVWTAKLRQSSTSDASADAASTKLAHVPTQITPHKTWIHKAAVLSDIERYASFTDFESSSHTHADCGRRARPASRHRRTFVRVPGFMAPSRSRRSGPIFNPYFQALEPPDRL